MSYSTSFPKQSIYRTQRNPKCHFKPTTSPTEIFRMVLSALRHLGPTQGGGTMAQVRCYILCHENIRMKYDKLTEAVKYSLHQAIRMGFLRRRVCDGKYYIAAESTGRCKRKSIACSEHKLVSRTSTWAPVLSKKIKVKRCQPAAARTACPISKCRNVQPAARPHGGSVWHSSSGSSKTKKNSTELRNPRSIPPPPAQYGGFCEEEEVIEEEAATEEDEEELNCVSDEDMEVDEHETGKIGGRKESKPAKSINSDKSAKHEKRSQPKEKSCSNKEIPHKHKNKEADKNGHGHKNKKNDKSASKQSARTANKKKKMDNRCSLM